MAVTTRGIDYAEIARCVVVDGRFTNPLPFVFVKFADADEGNRYVMPASQGLALFGSEPYRTTLEPMGAGGFPHDNFAGSRSSSPADDGSKPGPFAVHYFGSSGI